VYNDRINITNIGALPKGIELSNLDNFLKNEKIIVREQEIENFLHFFT
jgi:predicted HTH transcriptional regulator